MSIKHEQDRQTSALVQLKAYYKANIASVTDNSLSARFSAAAARVL